MHKDQLRNINPNHLYGCHPFDLRSFFGESSFSLIVQKPKDPFPPNSRRLLLLERRIKLKLPDRLPRAIDPGDLRRLLPVIDRVRDRALILILLRTGMRIGELLNTKVHDVDLNNHRILIYEAEKTSVGRVVYYSEDAKEALLSWLRVRNSFKENLFYGQKDKPLSYEAARSMFNKYLEKAPDCSTAVIRCIV